MNWPRSPEFKLINQIKKRAFSEQNVVVGIGDDAAIIQCGNGFFVTCVDTLVSGVHFLPECHPFDVGYKSLAVNLSDFAAMGAKPSWATLALTVPSNNAAWIDQFIAGFNVLANEFDVSLVGGDTTKGNLSITINVFGFHDEANSSFMLRKNAQPGDLIAVTGVIGDAGFGLKLARQELDCAEAVRSYFLQKLNQPYPKIKEGLLLANYANAAIDISDGLAVDLQHVLLASKVGAKIHLEQLPTSSLLRDLVPEDEDRIKLQLSAGDDYELLFTFPNEHLTQIEKELSALGTKCSVIGEIVNGSDIQYHRNNKEVQLDVSGFDHFI